jgi:hypothetical protein
MNENSSTPSHRPEPGTGPTASSRWGSGPAGRSPDHGLDPAAGPTSEALAKILSELRELTPASNIPEPGFPPRLHTIEKPPVRPQKIALEFEGARRARRPLKAAIASAALFAVGVAGANFAYPLLTGPSSPLRLALLERTASVLPDAAPGEVAQTPAPNVRATALASATRDTALPVAVEAAEDTGVSTTGAMSANIAPVRVVPPASEPERQPAPAAGARAPGEAAGVATPPDNRQSERVAELPAVTAPAQEPPAPIVVAGASPPALAPVAAAPTTVRVDMTARGEAKPNASPSPDPAAVANAERLVRRARDQIREGDISGARLVLERALASGSAQAAFALAQTYDPQMLAQWGAIGIRGDEARARQLYEMASERGLPEAKERMASFR